jgi:hypothetical protein
MFLINSNQPVKDYFEISRICDLYFRSNRGRAGEGGEMDGLFRPLDVLRSRKQGLDDGASVPSIDAEVAVEC